MDNQPPQIVPIQYPQSNYQQVPQQPQAQAPLGMFERRIGRLGFLLGVVY